MNRSAAPRRERSARRSTVGRSLTGWTFAAVLLAASCTPDAHSPAAPGDPCRATIDEAGASAEIRDQIELLDRALIICPDPQTFSIHVGRHPTLLGWDVPTYLTRRCSAADDDDVRSSRICTSEAVVVTTVPTVEIPDVVYVGTTLDGRQVEIRPRAGRPFDDGTPRVISDMADIAAGAGCPGVEAEFERWNERIDDPLIGDEASVYAQHALNVLTFIGCER